MIPDASSLVLSNNPVAEINFALVYVNVCLKLLAFPKKCKP